MRVGIIGAGKIGANLARQWSRRGHDILLSYKRDAKQLEALASGLGARWGTPRGAAAHGQVVLLATPWSILDDLADRVSLAVTIVIDATNPFVAGALAQLPADTSAGAANARTVRRLDAGQRHSTRTPVASKRQSAMANTGIPSPCSSAAKTPMPDKLPRSWCAGFEPVDLGGLREMPLMEAPRREGAVYGGLQPGCSPTNRPRRVYRPSRSRSARNAPQGGRSARRRSTMTGSANDVHDDHDRFRFVLEHAGSTAALVCRNEPGRLILFHTDVLDPLADRGVGGRLVQAARERATPEGHTILPWCPFARTWLTEHPDAVGRIDINAAMPSNGQRAHG
jgi:8-hydroxy-5-deazaflavin:NADPH oxidoreductase